MDQPFQAGRHLGEGAEGDQPGDDGRHHVAGIDRFQEAQLGFGPLLFQQLSPGHDNVFAVALEGGDGEAVGLAHVDLGVLGEGQIDLADRAKGAVVEDIHVIAALAGGHDPAFHRQAPFEGSLQSLGPALARQDLGQDDFIGAHGNHIQGDVFAFLHAELAILVEKFGFIGHPVKFGAGIHHQAGVGYGNDGSGDTVSNADLAAALGQRGLHEGCKFALCRHVFVFRRLLCHDRSEGGMIWARKRRAHCSAVGLLVKCEKRPILREATVRSLVEVRWIPLPM